MGHPQPRDFHMAPVIEIKKEKENNKKKCKLKYYKIIENSIKIIKRNRKIIEKNIKYYKIILLQAWYTTRQTLARLVVFPTPLTPQNVTTYGFFLLRASNASRNMSIRLLGSSSCTQASFKACFTVDEMALNKQQRKANYTLQPAISGVIF